VTAFLTLVRAVHFGSCLLLQAVFAVLFVVLMPAWNQSGGGHSPDRQRVHRLLDRLLVVCGLLAVASGFLWLWLSIAGMSGSSLSESLQPALFQMVLTQTQPGHVWMVRAAIALVFAAGLCFFPRRPGGSQGASLAFWLCGLSAMALTASLAWLGHAGAAEGPDQNIQLAGDVVHLVTAGFWPAGLVPFVVYLGCSLQSYQDPASLHRASAAARRFSMLSLLTVGVLVVSGSINSYFLVGSFEALLTTKYGHFLILKLVLFVAMIAIGAWNLFVTQRRLTVSSESPPNGRRSRALNIIRRNVWIEIVLGTLVLLAVGLLGTLPPAAHS